MGFENVSVMVTGTGAEGRARVIRGSCKVGAPVKLQHESDRDAIAVWLRCGGFLGLVPSWKKIGYVKVSHDEHLSHRLHRGVVRVKRSWVRSYWAPLDREHPQVALDLVLDEA
jgi:hypothetical protein